METGCFSITGENCYELANNRIKQDCQPEYEKQLAAGMRYCTEELVFLKGANLMVTVIIEKVDNSNHKCAVEIIVGGGRAVLFSITTGTERQWVRKLYKQMVDFCDGLGYEISNLEEK